MRSFEIRTILIRRGKKFLLKIAKLENQRENNDNDVSTKLKACLFSDNYRINV